MDTFISHLSAAILWEVPCLHSIMGFKTPEELRQAISCERVTSTSEPQRVRRADVRPHVDSLPFPKGSIVVRSGIRVACPELAFVEFAQTMGFHRTALLGLQMCAHDPLRPEQAITTAAKIRSYVEKCVGHRGRKAAAAAARYIADGSNSYMESLLYLLLCLPNQRGGFGLGGAVLNQRIELSRAKTSLPQQALFADLCWPKQRLAVEYDSREHHDNESSWEKDTQRATALRNHGYMVHSVTTPQLYSEARFKEAALAIAADLGIRVRIRTERFATEQQKLRELLPRA